MENQNFEFNEPQSPVEEAENKPQELPEGGFDAGRRNFLKVAVVGAASLLINPDEAFAKQEKKVEAPTVNFEKHGNHRKITGEGDGLNDLHKAVSNNFEAFLGDEIKKPANKFSIGNFRGHIGRKNGKYTLEYSVDLLPVDKEEKAVRIVGVRGKVWSGKGAKEGVEKLYAEEVVPWRQRMKEAYPEAHFSYEEWEDGSQTPSGTLYQEVCIMKGVMKK